MSINKLFIFAIALLLASKNSGAQIAVIPDSSLFYVKNEVKANRQYFKSYITDTKEIFISPTKWDTKQWLTFSSLSFSFSLLLNYDDEIRNFAQKQRTENLDQFSANFLEPWGSGYYSMSTMGFLYLSGTFFHNQRLKKVALLGAKTYLVSGIMVLLPKYFLGRKRPNQGADPYAWSGFGFRAKSFVSGHTTSAWSIATVIASEYNDKPAIQVLCYSIAGLTGLSRIYDDQHWFTDVLGAAFFGYAMGKLIYNQNNWKLKVEPYSTGKNFGLFLSYPIGEKEY